MKLLFLSLFEKLRSLFFSSSYESYSYLELKEEFENAVDDYLYLHNNFILPSESEIILVQEEIRDIIEDIGRICSEYEKAEFLLFIQNFKLSLEEVITGDLSVWLRDKGF